MTLTDIIIQNFIMKMRFVSLNKNILLCNYNYIFFSELSNSY